MFFLLGPWHRLVRLDGERCPKADLPDPRGRCLSLKFLLPMPAWTPFFFDRSASRKSPPTKNQSLPASFRSVAPFLAQFTSAPVHVRVAVSEAVKPGLHQVSGRRKSPVSPVFGGSPRRKRRRAFTGEDQVKTANRHVIDMHRDILYRI